MISSQPELDKEIKFISVSLCNNGFPLNVVQIVIKNKIIDLIKSNLYPCKDALFI